jgi:hypothetical protein
LALLPWAARAGICRVVGPISHLEWPAELELDGIPVGGLSGLAWEGAPGRLLAVSDDRGEIAPPRWLELEVSLPRAGGPALTVTPLSTVTLRGPDGQVLPRNGADPEAIVVDDERVWIASEGFRLSGVPPFVRAFHRDGRLALELPLPAHVLPADEPPRGARHNLAFEALALSADGGTLYAALEAALLQDGAMPEFGVPSPARILVFDLARRAVAREALYWTEPLPRRPLLPGGTHMAGLVDLAWLAPDRLLALERAFALGAGFTIRLYEVDLSVAEDLAVRPDVAALADPSAIRAATKELLFDFAATPARPRNVEGMALGAPGPDGVRPLLLVADNNFSPTEPAAQFFLLGLTCAPASADETP